MDSHESSRYDPVAELVKINPVPSMIMDMQTLSVAVVNQAAVGLLGYTEKELLGKRITDLVPAEDIQAVMQANIEPVPEGETEWRSQTRGGKTIYLKLKYRDTSYRGKAARFIVVLESSPAPFK